MLWGVVITLVEVIEEEVALEADVVEAGEGAREKDGRCSQIKESHLV